MRPQREFDLCLSLLKQGHSATEVSCLTGVPRSTVRDLQLGYARGPGSRSLDDCPLDDLGFLNREAYAHLLGLYLGDGCLSLHKRGVWRLRVTLDACPAEVRFGFAEA